MDCAISYMKDLKLARYSQNIIRLSAIILFCLIAFFASIYALTASKCLLVCIQHYTFFFLWRIYFLRYTLLQYMYIFESNQRQLQNARVLISTSTHKINYYIHSCGFIFTLEGFSCIPRFFTITVTPLHQRVGTVQETWLRI